MIILHIETSTHVCSVALSDENSCIFSKSNYEGMNHAALLSLFIQDALVQLKSMGKKLDAVSVSSGPGSYTGLRIGVSTAKGLCYGLDIPLISISTLEIMTIEAQKRIQDADDALFVPMIDARRMEVYDAIFDAQRNTIRQVAANIIDENSYAETINQHKTYFFGSGSAKCQHLVSSDNAVFLDDINPLAENMIQSAVQKYQVKDFVDIAYFEPFYLKEFHTTIPKKIR